MRLNALASDLAADIDYERGIAAEDPLPPDNRLRLPGSGPPLDALYHVQAPRLMRYFARRVGHQDARDLVHEAFVSFIATVARQARAVERPEAYLSRIAGNLVVKRARTAARRSAAFHVAADDVPLAGSNPHAHLEARDMLDRLETAMLGLRPMTREIYMAHRLDGYSYSEIAERTGLSVKRVEKHMTRAIAQLDAVLSKR